MNKTTKQAVDWLRERGGNCAVVKTKAGGRIFLAQGETMPFMPRTLNNIVEAGLGKFELDAKGKQVRFWLV